MKRNAVIPLIALLLFSLAITVNASYSTSILYTHFNSLTKYYESIGENITSTTIYVTNRLIWNSTTSSPQVAIGFSNITYSGEATEKYICVQWVKTSTKVQILIKEGTSEILLGETTYTNLNQTIRLRFTGSKLDVSILGTDGKYSAIITGFSYNIPIRAIATWGTSYSVADGYVQCDIGGYGSADVNITQWIPTIISIAMLGVVMGLLKKYTE